MKENEECNKRKDFYGFFNQKMFVEAHQLLNLKLKNFMKNFISTSIF